MIYLVIPLWDHTFGRCTLWFLQIDLWGLYTCPLPAALYIISADLIHLVCAAIATWFGTAGRIAATLPVIPHCEVWMEPLDFSLFNASVMRYKFLVTLHSSMTLNFTVDNERGEWTQCHHSGRILSRDVHVRAGSRLASSTAYCECAGYVRLIHQSLTSH